MSYFLPLIRKALLILFLLFFNNSFSQTLIINEVSNGPSGNQEYVEFIVVDTAVIYNCSSPVPPCIDIRGWIFDDNSGYHGAGGVAPGAVRFAFDPLWSCVPLGTIIVIYNNADPNTSMPANDLSLADGNCTVIAPLNSTLFESNGTTPGAVACSYPATGWTAGGSWSNTLFANSGDCARIVDLSGCEVFSLCWATDNSNNLIYFSSGGSGTDNVWSFNGGDPNLTANWTEGCADPSTCGSNNQTPGAPNNAANAAYISQFNNGCTPITPINVTASSTDAGCTCDGTATATVSGSIPGYSYAWYDASFSTLLGIPFAISNLCAGTYHVVATSSIGCSDTATVVINSSAASLTVTIPSNSAVCNGSAIAATNFISTPAGATFAWTNSNTAIGLAASGTGNIAAFTATNFTSAPITSTITVTPSLAGCAGTPSSFTITVNPTPTVIVPSDFSVCNNSIVAATNFISTPAGATFSWTNSNTTIGLAASGTGNIAAFTATNATTSPISSTITVTPTVSGCAGTPSSYSITVNPTPTVIVPSDFSVCDNSTVAATNFISAPAGATFSWTNSNTTIGLAASGTGNIASFTATNSTAVPITTTITVTPTLNGCAGMPSSYSITVDPTPTVIVPSDFSVCNNSTVAATNFISAPAGATFAWTNSNTTIGLAASGTGNIAAFTATNSTAVPITTTVTVTPTLNGCAGTPSSYSITVDPIPTVIVPSDFSVCDNSTVAATNFISAPAGATFAWTNSNTAIGLAASGTGNIASFTATNATTSPISSTISVTPTVNGCVGTPSSYIITVNPSPTVVVPANIILCNGGNVPATNFTSVPVAGTFAWTNANTAIGLAASGTGNVSAFIATNSTTSPISSTISVTPTVNGCTGTPSDYTVTVNSVLDATISSAGPFCESDVPINLFAVDAGGVWSGTGITDTLLGTFDPSVAGSGTFTITYSISGICSVTDTENIIVNPNMDAAINPAGPFCTIDPALALVAVNGGGTWSGTGITNTSLGIFDPSIAGSGTHSITYTINGMCSDAQTISIIVDDQFNATINSVANVCELDPAFNLIAADSGGIWSGTGIADSIAGIFNPSVAGVGTHTVTYSISGNCGDVQTTNITVLNSADATITPAGPFCVGNSSISLIAVDTGGVWSGTGITNFSTGIFDPLVAGVGTHAITYTISGQCGATRTIFIDVVANFSATITPAGPFCENASSVNLIAIDTGGIWSGNGITDSVNGIFNPGVAGSGTHTITYSIPGSCGDTQTTNIIVNPLPLVNFSVDNIAGCSPLTVTFTDNSNPVSSNVLWAISDGFTSVDTGSVTYTFNSVGCFDVTLVSTSAQGCTNTLTQNGMVCVSDSPVAEFSWTPVSPTILDPTIDFVNQSSGANNYLWNFAELGSSNLTNPSFTFPDVVAGSYEICLTAANTTGCSDTVCHLITLDDEFLVYVPNAFTVDGDGKNDIFLPIVSGHDPDAYELLIFNRWGELIFQTENSGTGWDGNHRGMIAKEDVYVWKIKLKKLDSEDVKIIYGHVSLLK